MTTNSSKSRIGSGRIKTVGKGIGTGAPKTQAVPKMKDSTNPQTGGRKARINTSGGHGLNH